MNVPNEFLIEFERCDFCLILDETHMQHFDIVDANTTFLRNRFGASLINKKLVFHNKVRNAQSQSGEAAGGRWFPRLAGLLVTEEGVRSWWRATGGGGGAVHVVSEASQQSLIQGDPLGGERLFLGIDGIGGVLAREGGEGGPPDRGDGSGRGTWVTQPVSRALSRNQLLSRSLRVWDAFACGCDQGVAHHFPSGAAGDSCARSTQSQPLWWSLSFSICVL